MPACCANSKPAFAITCELMPGYHVATIHCAGTTVNSCITACCSMHCTDYGCSSLGGQACRTQHAYSLSGQRVGGQLVPAAWPVGTRGPLGQTRCYQDALTILPLGRSIVLRMQLPLHRSRVPTASDFPPLVFQFRALLGLTKAGVRRT